MRNLILPFSFESREIRVVVIDGQPMFGARDVAVALGYSDPSQAYKQHCKYLKLLSSVECTELNWVNPNPRGEYAMPESDVYRLIVKSTKPEAERFEKWVFEEVLPSIRKTGNYTVGNNDPRSIEIAFTSCLNIAKLCGLVGNMAVLSADTGTLALTGRSALKLIGLTHLLADKNDKTYTVTELGQLISPKVSARKFNLMLEEAGLQKRELDTNNQLVPCEKAKGLYEWLDTNKKHAHGAPIKQLKWFRSVIEFVS